MFVEFTEVCAREGEGADVAAKRITTNAVASDGTVERERRVGRLKLILSSSERG
jgi:hypothetical protein